MKSHVPVLYRYISIILPEPQRMKTFLSVNTALLYQIPVYRYRGTARTDRKTENRTTQTNLKNSKNSELKLELEGWNLAQRPGCGIRYDTIRKKRKERDSIGRLEMR
jgi:hypothetical protein